MKVQQLNNTYFQGKLYSKPPVKPMKEIISSDELEELTQGASRPEEYTRTLKMYGLNHLDAVNELRRRQGVSSMAPFSFQYETEHSDAICGSMYIPADKQEQPYHVQIPRVRKFRSTARRIEQFDSLSEQLLSKRIRFSKEAFEAFGISNDMKHATAFLPPEYIDIMDDNFLSYLVAPSENLKLSSEEKAELSVKKAKGKLKKEKDIKRYNFSALVKNVSDENRRTEKLLRLSEELSVEDMNDIFFGTYSESKRKYLLLWLLDFNTKANEDEILNYLKHRSF